jgi:tetratricopeptide (TPR) repeat protein
VAKLELVHAAMGAELGEFPATLAAAEHSAELYRSVGDALGAARAQVEAATALVRLTRPQEAKPLLHAALTVARANGERGLAGKILNILGWLHGKDGEYDAARAACEEARAIHEALGHFNSQAVTLVTLGEIEFWSGRAERAMELAREALEHCRSEGLRSTICCNLAAYHVAADRLAEAHVYGHQALDIANAYGFVPQRTWALQHLAAVVVSRDPPLAARLLGFVESQYAALGERPEPTDAREYDTVLATLRSRLGADELAAERARGAVMSEEEALAQAARA